MFEALEETLVKILQKLDSQEELLQLTISSLRTKKEVANFLNKSEKTIDNYVKSGTFQKDVHYFFNERNKVEFIPTAIIQFKKTPSIKHKVKTSETIQNTAKRIYHPSIKSIAQGLKIG